MASVAVVEPRTKTLQDPELKAHLQELRRTDNWTNWYYLLRTYVILAAVIGGTVWFYDYQLREGLSIWWTVPLTFVAIVLTGAGQHQLSGLAHEGSHHLLFRNRYLNELASDWLCMFPLFSSLHHYRLQHHAHHQFVNDPLRDPDVSQLQTSGHWLSFPLARETVLGTLLRQLAPLSLVKFIGVRAKYNSTGTDKNPYMKKGWKPNKGPIRVGILYLLAQVGLLAGLVLHGDALLLGIIPWVLWLAVCAFFLRLPSDSFHQSRIHPLIHQRWQNIGRLTYITLVFYGVAWATLLTSRWVALWYLLLWIVPLFTSFAYYMILRQLVQHGNGGRGWVTNTRVFIVGRFINFAVFPMGQDYHLPHHMYASVPHYRLRRLHEVLLDYPEYRDEAVVVEGYFLPRHRPPTAPTVLDVLSTAYAPKAKDVHIDNSVLEDEVVEEKDAILEEGKREKERLEARNA